MQIDWVRITKLGNNMRDHNDNKRPVDLVSFRYINPLSLMVETNPNHNLFIQTILTWINTIFPNLHNKLYV